MKKKPPGKPPAKTATPVPEPPAPPSSGLVAVPCLPAMDPELLHLLKIICYMIVIAGGVIALALSMPAIGMIVGTAVPFVVGLILAYVFDPIVTFVQRRLKLSRIGGVAILYLMFVGVAVGFIAIVLPILIVQLKGAWVGIVDFLNRYVFTNERFQGISDAEFWKTLWTTANAWLASHNIDIREVVDVGAVVQGAGGEMRTAASTGLRAIVDTAGSVIAMLYDIITSIIGVGIFWTFVVLVNLYLLLDFSKLRNVMEVMIPSRSQPRTFEILGKCDVAVGGFIRGMLITSVLVGTLTFLGLFALGLKQYALLIGIIAGIGNLIPYLGAISGGLPAMFYVIFSDTYDSSNERLLMGLGVIVLVAAIQALEGFVFQPKIVGKNAQLHPIAVLFALALGANFGLLGMIVAVPVACIVRVLIKEFYWDSRHVDWKDRTGKRNLADRRDLMTRAQLRRLKASGSDATPGDPALEPPT